MTDQLSGQPLALVTGASSGLGKAIAQQLARRNYRLVIVARREDRLAALAEQINRANPDEAQNADEPRCTPITLDLANLDDIAPAVRRIMDQQGPIDVLINNAGFGRFGNFLDAPSTQIEMMMRVNYLAAAELTRLILPQMVQRKQGHVINISSIATKALPAGHASYNASKAALSALTLTLAAEYGDQGVHFSSVHPGIVRTEFFDHPSYAPLADTIGKHGMDVDRAAAKIVKLLDKPRLEMCMPSAYRFVDLIGVISKRLLIKLVSRHVRDA